MWSSYLFLCPTLVAQQTAKHSYFLRWSYECARSLNKRSGASVNMESGTGTLHLHERVRLALRAQLPGFRRFQRFAPLQRASGKQKRLLQSSDTMNITSLSFNLWFEGLLNGLNRKQVFLVLTIFFSPV